ncbi:MAG: hypothetical protein J7M08_07585 [Planctomycetes bacterium]|nr:hypothetical protein [Planctomycetota bacterium]
MIARTLLKPVLSILVGLLALAALIVIGLLVLLGHVVKVGIEKAGPLVAAVPIQVQDVRISLPGQSFTMIGFEMGNPEGFDAPTSVYVGAISVEARLATLLKDEIVLPRIEVDRPKITLEFRGKETNLARIMKQMKIPKGRSEKKLRIGLLRITHPSVEVAGLPLGKAIKFDLPDIELRDLSAGGKPKSPREVAVAVLEAIQKQILDAAPDYLSAERLLSLSGEMNKALENGTRLLDEASTKLGDKANDLLKRLAR